MNMKDMPCAYWGEGNVCLKDSEPDYVDFCVLGPCSQMVPSRGDEFRKMSDEEMANVLSWLSDKKTAREWLAWLKQEVRDGKL